MSFAGGVGGGLALPYIGVYVEFPMCALDLVGASPMDHNNSDA